MKATYNMSTRLDEGVIPKIATYISCDHFSIDAIARYEELGLARGRRRRRTLPSRRRGTLLAVAICHVENGMYVRGKKK
jgi:hypothetical protein